MFLTRISVTHPVFTTMMMVALLVMGVFSFQRLGLDQYPNVDVPNVVVMTTYPGATPETVETEVTRPVEDALNAIGGLDDIMSTSYEGRSVVSLNGACENRPFSPIRKQSRNYRSHCPVFTEIAVRELTEPLSRNW